MATQIVRDKSPMAIAKRKAVDVMAKTAAINITTDEGAVEIGIDGNIDSDFMIEVNYSGNDTFSFRVNETNNFKKGQRGFITIWNKSDNNMDIELRQFSHEGIPAYYALNGYALVIAEYFAIEDNELLYSVFGSWEFTGEG